MKFRKILLCILSILLLHGFTVFQVMAEEQAKINKAKDLASVKKEPFIAGQHYIVLDKPITTRDNSKIEVVEMFSYGCPHCYEFEPFIKQWAESQAKDVDFWFFPAVWNKPMELFARAFYVAQDLNVEQKIHLPLFSAIAVEHKLISNETELANFFAKFNVDKKAFIKAYKSKKVVDQVEQAKIRVENYKPVGVPELVINGKYRVDRMHAGGLKEMLEVAEFLINNERKMKSK
jgi:thiol:disulfide interchange protein DsbA